MLWPPFSRSSVRLGRFKSSVGLERPSTIKLELQRR